MWQVQNNEHNMPSVFVVPTRQVEDLQGCQVTNVVDMVDIVV